MKIDVLAAGQIVPPFEVLDATSKKVLDGFHSIAVLGRQEPGRGAFSGPPGGRSAWITSTTSSWLYVGGGLDMWRDSIQGELKLRVTVWPAHPSACKAFGWFEAADRRTSRQVPRPA